jgi:hypothetical protein
LPLPPLNPLAHSLSTSPSKNVYSESSIKSLDISIEDMVPRSRDGDTVEEVRH